MCGRYGLFTPPTELQRRFDVTVEGAFEPTYNAAPGESLPVIVDARPDEITTLEWGLIPDWADDARAHRHVNARAETLFERASFAEAAEGRRCLVLADGFYEWGAPTGTRRPHFVRREDGEPFAMAGLWERWTPPSTQVELDAVGDPEPDTVETFTIVTTGANAAMEPIHDRMPVMLPPEREREWLAGAGTTGRALLTPPPADDLAIHPVSRAVNDPTNDGPDLLTPIEE